MGVSEQDHEEGARSFTRALEMINDGDLVVEASEVLHALLVKLHEEAVHTNGDARGELKLTLKLAVEPSGVASIAYDLASKEPKPHRPKGHLWLTKGGNLTPHNPRQQKLPLHEVAREIRDMGGSIEVTSGSSKAREV